jgi:hypothetical protein
MGYWGIGLLDGVREEGEGKGEGKGGGRIRGERTDRGEGGLKGDGVG